MYSKRNSFERENSYIITPPPGYDGSRFGRRSDGRDDAFPPYDRPLQQQETEKRSCTYSRKKQPVKEAQDSSVQKERGADSDSLSLFHGVLGKEELLIIALLISLVGEKEATPELILILGLLLCV